MKFTHPWVVNGHLVTPTESYPIEDRVIELPEDVGRSFGFAPVNEAPAVAPVDAAATPRKGKR